MTEDNLSRTETPVTEITGILSQLVGKFDLGSTRQPANDLVSHCACAQHGSAWIAVTACRLLADYLEKGGTFSSKFSH